MTAGEQGISQSITATGDTPIKWSLEGSAVAGVPAFVSIDATGVLTVSSRATVGTYNFIIKAENAAGSDSKACELRVLEPRTAPVFKQDGQSYVFEVAASSGGSFSVQASGSAPISYSLGVYKGDLPSGLSIDRSTGTVSVAPRTPVGSYSFVVTATNDVGSAEQVCVLEVVREIRPRSGGDADGTDSAVELLMEKTDPAAMLPAASPGPHISNLIEADPVSQPEINVSAQSIAFGNMSSFWDAEMEITEPAPKLALMDRAAMNLEVVKAEHYWSEILGEAKSIDRDLIDRLRETEPPPLNSVTIRRDDFKDVYTNDRYTVNGAEFITWISHVKVDVYETELMNNDGYWPGGTFDAFFTHLGAMRTGTTSGEPVKYADLYHYPGYNDVFNVPQVSGSQDTTGDTGVVTFWDLDLLNGFLDSFLGGAGGFGAWAINGWDTLGLDGFLDPSIAGETSGFRDPRAGPEGRNFGVAMVQTLEYGSHLEEMAELKNGNYKVGLDEYTGSNVPAEYFTTLAGNKAMNLTFEQEGVGITFSGNDLTNQDGWLPIYDFGFTPTSSYARKMFESAELDPDIPGEPATPAKSFSYSFSHHGDLPGMATFDIATGIAEGEKVNVYKYDSRTDVFTTIASNVKVGSGGIVSYRNNTMSEYLITTETMPGAISQPHGINWLLIVLIIAAVLLAAVAAVVIALLLRKGGRRASAAGAATGAAAGYPPQYRP